MKLYLDPEGLKYIEFPEHFNQDKCKHEHIDWRMSGIAYSKNKYSKYCTVCFKELEGDK